MTVRLLPWSIWVALSLAGGLSITATMQHVEAPQGRIEGVVRDVSGAPLPGVSVTTIPQPGGKAHHTTTTRDGHYRLDGLPEDTYRVDFALRGFVGARHNHVRVRHSTPASLDPVLVIRPVCECITVGSVAAVQPAVGQVVDDRGNPVPHARLQLVGPDYRETSHADRDGRFLLRPSTEAMLRLAASDSGFETVTRQIPKASTERIVVGLRYTGTKGLPDSERFNEGCLCPGHFAHEGQ